MTLSLQVVQQSTVEEWLHCACLCKKLLNILYNICTHRSAEELRVCVASIYSIVILSSMKDPLINVKFCNDNGKLTDFQLIRMTRILWKLTFWTGFPCCGHCGASTVTLFPSHLGIQVLCINKTAHKIDPLTSLSIHKLLEKFPLELKANLLLLFAS